MPAPALHPDSGDEDVLVLENLNNLAHIQTALYDPNHRNNPQKLNYAVQQAFLGQPVSIPDALQPCLSTARLADMLDFGRKDFTKSFSLSPAKRDVTIDTKWPVVRLGEVCDVLIGGTPSRDNNNYFTGNNLWLSISEMTGRLITQTKEKITDAAIKDSNVKLIPKGTTLLSFKLSIGKTAIAGVDLYTNEAIAGLIPKNNAILDGYLYQLFNAKLIDLENIGFKAFGKSLNSAFLKDDVKIPLPPLDVQAQIVADCETVDAETANAQTAIGEAKRAIENEIQAEAYNRYPERRLSELA